MAGAEKLTTTVSSKGQVILPSAIRARRQWRAGTRLTVEDTSEGVLLKLAAAFAETRPEDVFGVLPTGASRRRWKKWTQACLRKPGAGMLAIDTDLIVRDLIPSGHVRFDEQGRETERLQMAQATAPFLDSTIP